MSSFFWSPISSSGDSINPLSKSIIPDTNNAYDLGSTTKEFANIYVSYVTQANGLIRFDVNGGFFNDSLGQINLDLDNRKLYDSTPTLSIDYQLRQLLDSSGFLSLDYQNRILQDSTSVNSINYEGRQLLDGSGILSIDFQNRVLDSGAGTTIDYANQQLLNGSGTMLDWSNSAYISAENHYVRYVNNPFDNSDATNKLYVDTGLGLKINTSSKAVANGVASLDANALIPVNQIPPAALERMVIVANQTARFALTTATVQNGDTVYQTDTTTMYFVKDDTNLNNASGYQVYSAGTAVNFSGTLSGDVTGGQSSTVVSTVGGSSATNIHSAELLANAASPLNFNQTIVMRDSGGNFSAGIITANLTGNASTATSATSATTATNITATSNSTLTTLSALSLPGSQVTGFVANATSATSATTATTANSANTVNGTNVVTNANLVQMPTLTLKGNNTGSTGNALDLTVSQVNTMLGSFANPMTTGGDTIYGGASGLATRLANGTANQILQSNGGTSAPSWVSALTLTGITVSSNIAVNGNTSGYPIACKALSGDAVGIEIAGRSSDNLGRIQFSNNTSSTIYGVVGGTTTGIEIRTNGNSGATGQPLLSGGLSAGTTWGTLSSTYGGTGNDGGAWTSSTPALQVFGVSSVSSTGAILRTRTIGKTYIFNLFITVAYTGTLTGLKVQLTGGQSTVTNTFQTAHGYNSSVGFSITGKLAYNDPSGLMSIVKYDGNPPIASSGEGITLTGIMELA